VYIPHVVTGHCPGWVATGSGISTVTTEQVITWEQNPGELNPLIHLGLDTIHSSRDYLFNTNSRDTWSSCHPTWTTTGHHMRYVHCYYIYVIL